MPLPAAAYIYRNLTKKCFSVKFGGKVITQFTKPLFFYGFFVVNPAGRDRVRAEGKKYVHAFCATRGILHDYIEKPEDMKREVVYNPRINDTFVYKDTGLPLSGHHTIIMEYPKVYVLQLV